MEPTRIPADEHDTDPALTGRRVVDVTDRLTPGAKALARARTYQRQRTADMLRDGYVVGLREGALAHERTANLPCVPRYAPLPDEPHPPLVKARLSDAVADALAVQPEPWHDGFNTLIATATRQMRDHEDAMLRAAFTSGRAYERGAAIRRRVGKSLAARRTAAEEAAREYLDERTPDAPRLAAMVLAGFAGTEVA